jgi:hypothetical protein
MWTGAVGPGGRPAVGGGSGAVGFEPVWHLRVVKSQVERDLALRSPFRVR